MLQAVRIHVISKTSALDIPQNNQARPIPLPAQAIARRLLATRLPTHRLAVIMRPLSKISGSVLCFAYPDLLGEIVGEVFEFSKAHTIR